MGYLSTDHCDTDMFTYYAFWDWFYPNMPNWVSEHRDKDYSFHFWDVDAGYLLDFHKLPFAAKAGKQTLHLRTVGVQRSGTSKSNHRNSKEAAHYASSSKFKTQKHLRCPKLQNGIFICEHHANHC